jgi:hypothetical protein
MLRELRIRAWNGGSALREQYVTFVDVLVQLRIAVAIDVVDFTNKNYILSNLKMKLVGSLVSDDVSLGKKQINNDTLEDVVKSGNTI